MDLLKNRVRCDPINRETAVLSQYDLQKVDLPRRRDYIGAVTWLRVVMPWQLVCICFR